MYNEDYAIQEAQIMLFRCMLHQLHCIKARVLSVKSSSFICTLTQRLSCCKLLPEVERIKGMKMEGNISYAALEKLSRANLILNSFVQNIMNSDYNRNYSSRR